MEMRKVLAVELTAEVNRRRVLRGIAAGATGWAMALTGVKWAAAKRTQPPATLPESCMRPLVRHLATQGEGTAGVSQCLLPDGYYAQTIVVHLTGAERAHRYSVYSRQEDSWYAGIMKTDGRGNASFSATIRMPLDRYGGLPIGYVVLLDADEDHEAITWQYTTEIFNPCSIC